MVQPTAPALSSTSATVRQPTSAVLIAGMRQGPGQCELGQALVVLRGDALQLLDRVDVAWERVGSEERVEELDRAHLALAGPPVLRAEVHVLGEGAGEQPEGERSVGHDADAFGLAVREDVLAPSGGRTCATRTARRRPGGEPCRPRSPPCGSSRPRRSAPCPRARSRRVRPSSPRTASRGPASARGRRRPSRCRAARGSCRSTPSPGRGWRHAGPACRGTQAELGDDDRLVAPRAQCLAERLLRGAVSLGRVEAVDAQVERAARPRGRTRPRRRRRSRRRPPSSRIRRPRPRGRSVRRVDVPRWCPFSAGRRSAPRGRAARVTMRPELTAVSLHRTTQQVSMPTVAMATADVG